MTEDLLAADWGTTQLRVYRIGGGRVLERAQSEDGVSRLAAGAHRDAFLRLAGRWLAADPGLPVLLVGMVGSREGWATAPYAELPAGPEEIAAALLPVDLGDGRIARIVPGLAARAPADVMRGEETLALGSGVGDGLVCLPGTHSKWVTMRAGRVTGFASFMTGEMYGLLRHHAMAGRPATEPTDPAGFARGLAAVAGDRAEGSAGLLALAFRARAAVLTGGLSAAELGPYLSGLVIGEEIAGARALFGDETPVLVADAAQAELYRQALPGAPLVAPETALVAGLARIATAAGPPVSD